MIYQQNSGEMQTGDISRGGWTKEMHKKEWNMGEKWIGIIRNIHLKFLAEHWVYHTQCCCTTLSYWVLHPTWTDHETCMCKQHEWLCFIVKRPQQMQIYDTWHRRSQVCVVNVRMWGVEQQHLYSTSPYRTISHLPTFRGSTVDHWSSLRDPVRSWWKSLRSPSTRTGIFKDNNYINTFYLIHCETLSMMKTKPHRKQRAQIKGGENKG